nr:site-specific integrase [Cryobacterium ruanii]
MSTVTVAAASIRDIHLSEGHRDPCASRGVSTVLAGLRRKLGTAPAHQARAIELSELKRILSSMDRSTIAGKRDAAILLVGFASAMRRSELAAMVRRDVRLSVDGVRIRIQRSKTDQNGEGVIIGLPAGKNDETCPLRALRIWLGARGGSTNDAVFTRVSRTGSVLAGSLTPQSMNLILKSRARAAGVDMTGLSVHGLRSGHITAANRAGVNLTDIMRTSRHTSVKVLLSYVRENDVLDGNNSGGSLGL